MKVKDLIKELQKMDPNAEVIVTTSNFEQGQSQVPVKYVNQYKTGSKREEQFRDAFDDGRYFSEVWSTVGGKLKVVTIS